MFPSWKFQVRSAGTGVRREKAIAWEGGGKKSGFVLAFDRWIRRGLKDTMDHTLRDPQAITPVTLNPAAVQRLWQAFLDGTPGIYWSRLWSIYVFVRWCHRHR